MQTLDAQTLKGLWSAVPTPWNSHGDLDEGALRRNCEKLAAARVDGIYTTDSDGEFYAIELDEFRRLARVFGKAMESTGVEAAMGVSWGSTQGIIDRIKASCDAGIPNVHVAFPMFMPPARPDVPRFWEDLARAVPGARWVHYAHPRCGPELSGADYARLSRQFPEQFIGTKLSTPDVLKLTEVLTASGHLAHFATDRMMAVATMLGARGCYSYWINTLPRWHRAYMTACLEGRWAEALACHRRLDEWERTHVLPLRQPGHLHGIVGKARGALTGFLEDSGITRAPYYPVADALQKQLKVAFLSYWRDEIAAEGFRSSAGSGPSV